MWLLALLSLVQLPSVALGRDHPRIDLANGCRSTQCHAGIGIGGSVHAPVAQGACDSCHDLAARHPRFLRVFTYQGEPDHYLPVPPAFLGAAAVCWECHDKDLLSEGPAPRTRFRSGTKNLHATHVETRPVQGSRTCFVCHDPHAAPQEALVRPAYLWVATKNWSLPIEFRRTRSGGSCVVGCHRPQEYRTSSPDRTTGE